MIKTPALFLTGLALALTPACAQDQADAATDGMSRGEVETIVREYLLENPELIEEALIELQARKQEADAAAAQQAITDNAEALYENGGDYSIGPDDAPVTVVEFFDYRCGYCKRALGYVSGLPDAHDGQVRVVFKEFPILSPQSEQAALAALAAGKQGKYAEMHTALMESDTKLNAGDIDDIAKSVGVDVEQMRADMESGAITRHIADNKALARDLGVSGTPAFFVGDTAVSGANTPKVDSLIEEALAG